MAQVVTVKFVGRGLIYGLSLVFYLKIPFSGLRIACDPWWNGCEFMQQKLCSNIFLYCAIKLLYIVN